MMKDPHVFHRGLEDEELLFWIVVQACRDIVRYKTEGAGAPSREDFLHALEWVVEGVPQNVVVEILDNGEALVKEYTFREALEELGVHPDNVEHIRDTIARGPMLKSGERKRLARECYAKLEGPEYEPEPFWRTVQNLIMNKDTSWTDVQEAEEPA